MGILGYLSLTVSLAVVAVFTRLYVILAAARSAKPHRPREVSDKCSFAVFLGSGGHTSEALSLLSALDFGRYVPRTYIISEGDALSMQKVVDLESEKAAEVPHASSPGWRSDPPFAFIVIPRARRVHQSLLTTPFSVATSLAASMWHITITPVFSGPPVPEVLLLNGPGTCFVLCIATHMNRFLGLKSPRLIYVESFARLKHLSLSGKLLRPLVDSFVVQWPDLVRDANRDKCRGWLV